MLKTIPSLLLNKVKKLDIPIWMYVTALLVLTSGHLVFALRTNTYFSVDDFAVLAAIKNTSFLGMISDFLLKGDPFGFRKVMGYTVFRGIFEVFGTNEMAFIYTNHIIHTVNTVLLFFLLRLLTKRNLPAFVGAVIFNKYYLFYFSNIHEYLVTLFSLLSVFIFLKFPKQRGLSILFFILALLTKEVAFSVPFFLLTLSIVRKTEWKKVVPFFWVLGLYALYQLYFLFSVRFLPTNTSYQVVLSLEGITSGINYYLGVPLLMFLLLLPLLTKKYSTYSILLVGLMALFPALLLINRREAYYLYFPATYFLVFLAHNIPKQAIKGLLVIVLAGIAFGGRDILPSVARQNFPNWQKESLQAVVERVEEELVNKPSETEILIKDLNLERDARLMLESDVLDLFLSEETALTYDFVYTQQSATIKATRKDI